MWISDLVRLRRGRKIDTRGYGLLFTYDQPRDNWRRMKNYRKRRTAAYLLSWNRMRKAYKTRNGAKKFRGSWYDRTIDTLWVNVPSRFYKGQDFIQQLRNR